MKWNGDIHIRVFVSCKLFLTMVKYDAFDTLAVRLGRTGRVVKAGYKKPSGGLPEGIKGRL